MRIHLRQPGFKPIEYVQPFAGGAYETFSKNLNAQKCVNFFAHIDQEGGTSILSLRGTPGLKEWCDTGKYAEVRGEKRVGDDLYAIVGNSVFRVVDSAISTECTGTLETHSGKASMDTNGFQLMIVDGLYGYIVEGTTLTKITDEGFFKYPTTVTYQDGYFIVAFKGSGRGQVSDLNDGSSWDATMYFNAEGDPDKTKAILSDHRDLIMFGEDTMETWYNSGATVPFDRKPGYSQEVGLGARHSPAQLENTVYFLTNNFQIARLQGAQPKVISSRSIDYQIAQDTDRANAIGISAMIEGNAFYILTTANNTWCYNAATQFCHKLASYPEPFTGRWRGNCSEYFDKKTIIGDYQNGKLYELDFDTFTDNSQTIKRIRIPSEIKQGGKNIFHNSLEIFFESGVGLDGGVQGEDPMAMLQYSNDAGHTWSNEIWRSIGKIGKYQWRAMWNRLGASRHRNYKLIVSDPVKWVITGANLEGEIGVA